MTGLCREFPRGRCQRGGYSIASGAVSSNIWLQKLHAMPLTISRLTEPLELITSKWRLFADS
jgi:hypothetical protein